MPRMIDQIRQSAVPANVMRSAALGALELPPAETMEILVHLTTNPVFGEQAKMTLAGWDEAASLAVAADPATPQAVLDYLVAPQNRRPALMSALIENPSVPEQVLVEMAQTASRELIAVLLASPRVMQSARALRALARNENLEAREAEQVRAALAPLGPPPPPEFEEQEILDIALTHYSREHASDIAAEEGRPFELFESTPEEQAEALAQAQSEARAEAQAGALAQAQSEAHAKAQAEGHLEAQAAARAEAQAADAVDQASAPAPAPAPTPAKAAEPERLTPLQRIARLTVGERVQLAMKGSREERMILIRDGSRVISSAVLESPKLTDAEVESFAAMKNVQENVLRGIASKRKFMKRYAVVRALVNNPRTPFEVSLPLLNHLLVMDLRSLTMNKSVADTIRTVALKLFRTKSEAR